MKKLQVNLAFTMAQLNQSEVRATHDGVVVHGYSEWRGERYDEGSSAFPGNAAVERSIRFTVGGPKETEALLAALKSIGGAR